MTIQANVLIWTILCFCAFMLILWRLLLKPLLSFMDTRNARIARARSLDKTAELAEMRALAESKAAAEAHRRSEERKQAVQSLREESRLEREARERRFRQEIQEHREDMESEAAELVPLLAVSPKDHINTFTDKLMPFGER